MSHKPSTHPSTIMICIAFLLSLLYIPYLVWVYFKINGFSKLVLDGPPEIVPTIGHPLRFVDQSPVQPSTTMTVLDDKIMEDDYEFPQASFEVPGPAQVTHQSDGDEGQAARTQTAMMTYSNAARRLYNLAHDSPDTFKLPNKIKWDTFKGSLNLSIGVQTPETGQLLLRSLSPIDTYGLHHSFELMRYAAYLDDVFAGCRIMGNMGRYDENQVKEASSFWNTKFYNKDTMLALPEKWAWDYANALHACVYANSCQRKFWRCVSGAFMESSAPVSHKIT
ncbi:uncharacterized protein L199_001082 [Kwoniella botswanensis]|uniref:uncharacterized protein n=1 Tax=Kwoniella botswanensis TaxID=1268659 RepID=UPI00315D83C7